MKPSLEGNFGRCKVKLLIAVEGKGLSSESNVDVEMNWLEADSGIWMGELEGTVGDAKEDCSKTIVATSSMMQCDDLFT